MFVPRIGFDGAGGDIASKMLADRIIMLDTEVNNESSALVISELLYLESVDAKKDITLYINSPGGIVSDGMAIFDTMNYISCDVATICVGMAASMGAFLLAAGTKGKRYILPNAEVLIHQPLGGVEGQATEIEIVAKHIIGTKKKLNTILAQNTGVSYKKMCSLTERDKWLSAEEALKLGIVDSIISKRSVK